jgi:hypothetical protein
MGGPVLSLRCFDMDVVSSYGIVTMRRNPFANLWWQRRSTASWCRRCTLGEAWRRSRPTSGAPPVTGKAPIGVMNSGEALGAVGSAWVVVYWHGNESLG